RRLLLGADRAVAARTQRVRARRRVVRRPRPWSPVECAAQLAGRQRRGRALGAAARRRAGRPLPPGRSMSTTSAATPVVGGADAASIATTGTSLRLAVAVAVHD